MRIELTIRRPLGVLLLCPLRGGAVALLYFLPLPHGHMSLRPTLARRAAPVLRLRRRRGWCAAAAGGARAPGIGPSNCSACCGARWPAACGAAACGTISPDGNRFERRCACGVGRLLAHRRRRRSVLDHHAEDALDRFVGDVVLERFEDLERFFFVLDARVFLTVAAQADAGLEVIHHVQMVHPLAVDDRQQQIALLDDAQDLRRDFASPWLRTLSTACSLRSRRISSRSLLPQDRLRPTATL